MKRRSLLRNILLGAMLPLMPLADRAAVERKREITAREAHQLLNTMYRQMLDNAAGMTSLMGAGTAVFKFNHTGIEHIQNWRVYPS